MHRLNSVRTNFKHRGAFPGQDAVEQARRDVTAFFEDNTPRVFGISFGNIDMADVIPQVTIREKLKNATAESTSGNRIEAMALLVEAFEELFDSYVDPYSYPPSPFSFGRDIHYPMREQDIQAALSWPGDRAHRRPIHGASNLARQISQVTDAALAIQRALRVIALGLDYRRYHRFQRLTPRLVRLAGGPIQRSYPDDYAPGQEDFDYCQQFVITVALRLAELEAPVAPE